MGNDPKVRALYEDFYRDFGAAAAWTAPAQMRMYRDRLPAFMQKLRRSSEAKAKLARVVSKAPEVMVKVTGRTYEGGHLGEHMNYITRNGKVAAETEYGTMKGKEAVRDLHADWSDDEAIYGGQHQVRKAPLSVNMVLSMPPGVDRERFRNAVRDFVEKEIRPRSEAILAFHDDTQHPHAHVTVRGRQHNGRAFNPGKPVLERYREQFASALRERGIEAEATPRYARGRTIKAERQQMRHMRARGLMPRHVGAAISEAHKDATKGARGRAGQGDRSRPWEKAATDRQSGAKIVYQAAARELARSRSPADQRLAVQVLAYATAMPEPQFRHGLYKEALQQQSRDRTRDGEAPPGRTIDQRSLNRHKEPGQEPKRDTDRTRDGPQRGR